MYFREVDGEVLVADGSAQEDFHALDLHATEASTLEEELIARVPADVLADNPSLRSRLTKLFQDHSKLLSDDGVL
eukprot:3760513-Rhodomonas_salina.1